MLKDTVIVPGHGLDPSQLDKSPTDVRTPSGSAFDVNAPTLVAELLKVRCYLHEPHDYVVAVPHGVFDLRIEGENGIEKFTAPIEHHQPAMTRGTRKHKATWTRTSDPARRGAGSHASSSRAPSLSWRSLRLKELQSTGYVSIPDCRPVSHPQARSYDLDIASWRNRRRGLDRQLLDGVQVLRTANAGTSVGTSQATTIESAGRGHACAMRRDEPKGIPERRSAGIGPRAAYTSSPNQIQGSLSSASRQGAVVDEQLEALADSQGKWSATANGLKSTHERMRKIAFALSIVGALLAAIASQRDGDVRLYLALASTVMFSVMSFIALTFLEANRSQAWVRARVAAEALKREAYKYAASAAPYNDPATRASLLRTEVDRIEKDVDDLLVQQVSGKRGSTPGDMVTPVEYIDRRIKGQAAQYFEGKALEYQKKAKGLRRFELALALATAVIAGIVGSIEKQTIAGLAFDFAALIAVLTTVSGTIAAYIEASRYEFTVTLYRATARRLRAQAANAPLADIKVPSPEWSAYVEQCEAILQEESSSWVAKFGKP